jgi:hypothetical protein
VIENVLGKVFQFDVVGSFQSAIVPRLETLITNGIEINEMFNKTLKQELVPIMRYIEDGYLGGKCNFERTLSALIA